MAAAASAAAAAPVPSIAVPQVRPVLDYAQANAAVLKPGGGTRRYNEIDPVTTAYIRSQEDVFAPQTMEQVLMDYDMDEQDEQWLSKHNAKVCGAEWRDRRMRGAVCGPATTMLM